MQTVDELVDQLRSQLDETDTIDVSDDQLLSALNRAQRSAANIVARKYDSLFWAVVSASTDGTSDLDIPAGAFGRRVEMVEILIGQTRNQMKRIGNHKTSALASTNYSGVPHSYTLTKNKITLYPQPRAGITVYISYSKRPAKLVAGQGRITSFTDPYVIVDELGEDISTSVDNYAAYVNVIDYQTGDIRATLQISAIDTDSRKVTFKTTGLTRTSVLGQTIATALPSDLQEDDYICSIQGTCVPELDEAYVDYLLQYSVVEIKRRFGESIDQELIALKDLAEELETIWAGRESGSRVVRANAHYHGGLQRRTLV